MNHYHQKFRRPRVLSQGGLRIIEETHYKESSMILKITQVVNIDQDGNDHLPGKIEITDDDLLLHQKKKQPISWPIRTLRRYGYYDRNIFTFEAGRRCPTGEGIFAFRCDQAEQLFRLLQLKIQRGSGSATDHVGSSFPEPRTARFESVGSLSSCPHTPVSPQVPFTETSFCNFAFDPKSSMDSVLATTDGKPTSIPSSPLYINMPNDIDEDLNEESLPHAAYLFLTEKYDKPYPSPLTFPSPSLELTGEELARNNLQYITLELGDKSSPLVKTPVLEEGRSPGYTTIDFQKTWALVQSIKPNPENDRGCTRRTRHNSTLYEFQTPYQ